VSQPERRRFELLLTDAGGPDDGDPYVRLRGALKRLLRSFALRCTSVRELPPRKGVPPTVVDNECQGR
jgi:hypothetical protein